jgi:hypothetical protein
MLAQHYCRERCLSATSPGKDAIESGARGLDREKLRPFAAAKLALAYGDVTPEEGL